MFRGCALSFRKSLNSSHRPSKASPIRQRYLLPPCAPPNTQRLFSLRSTFPSFTFPRRCPPSGEFKENRWKFKALSPLAGRDTWGLVRGGSQGIEERDGPTVIAMLIVCEGLRWILLHDHHCYDASHTVTILPNILSPNHRQLWPPWYRHYPHPSITPPTSAPIHGYDLLTNSNVSWLCYVCTDIHPWWKMTRVLRKRGATWPNAMYLQYRSAISYCSDHPANFHQRCASLPYDIRVLAMRFVLRW